MANMIGFFNGYICRGGKLREESLHVDLDTGFIVDAPFRPVNLTYDLHGHILAPAFLELQTNGCTGFHFTNTSDAESYTQNLGKVSKYLITTGVGSFWATIPTVSSNVFQTVSKCAFYTMCLLKIPMPALYFYLASCILPLSSSVGLSYLESESLLIDLTPLDTADFHWWGRASWGSL
jgi:hypothetical protein